MAKIPISKIVIVKCEIIVGDMDRSVEFSGQNCWKDSAAYMKKNLDSFLEGRDNSYKGFKNEFAFHITIEFPDEEIFQGGVCYDRFFDKERPGYDTATIIYTSLEKIINGHFPGMKHKIDYCKNILEKYDIPTHS